MGLAALHREVVVVAGRIAGDQLEVEPEHVLFIIAGH